MLYCHSVDSQLEHDIRCQHTLRFFDVLCKTSITQWRNKRRVGEVGGGGELDAAPLQRAAISLANVFLLHQ